MDLNLLNCFQVVADKGSISLASSTLHLSQPAISLQIQRLEEQIGGKLFDRHNRGLILTSFGVRFLEKTRRLLEIQKEMISLAEDDGGVPTGPLAVGTYTTASSYLLAKPVAAFLAKYRDITLSYKYEETRALLDKVKNHTLDCAILSDAPPESCLDALDFFQDELVLVTSSKRKDFATKSISPNKLADMDFLSYPLRYDLCYRKVEAKFGAHLAKSRIVLETESFDTLKQMLLMGAGVTFIPKYLIAKELQAERLSEIKVGETQLPICFSFITRKSAELSPAVKAFRTIVLEHFGKTPS